MPEACNKKRFLFVMRTAPYGSSIAREGIDALLTCAAYDQSLSVLFMNDGVTLLLGKQNPQHIAQKNLQKMISALELYDVNELYVSQQCLSKRGISSDNLSVPTKLLHNADINTLFDNQDFILHF